MDSQDAELIREALQNIPRDQSSSIGNPPSAEDILYLPSHAAALDPNVALVIGNRGMGKTFWANALLNDQTRTSVVKRNRVSRAVASLENFTVSFAFADRQGVTGVSAHHIKEHAKFNVEDYWRAVVIGRIEDRLKLPGLPSFDDLLLNPEKSLSALSKIDKKLTDEETPILILFDQLDQIAENWTQIQRVTQGILRLALACKSYRSIKLKIFMRPDQAADEELFRFSDASKLLGPSASLRWYAVDLFGLLFKHLWKDDLVKGIMERSFPGLQTDHLSGGVPGRLLRNADLQSTCFEAIAGEAMGTSTKRGRPYTWLITHLADGKQQISPRSFLTALRVSAEHPEIRDGLAIDHHGIQAGVAEASNLRHAELEEDYPWIEMALQPLRGQSVPASQEEFYNIWRELSVPEEILAKFADAKAPLEISRAEGELLPQALERSLVQLGVFEDRDDGRVNIPDIFRISAGLKRKGGVPPQRRKTY
ncbi:ATP-binding protein [Epibacterium sp. DP7N7-1]|nr:ATP-binding protein [Epibacterium sp. DP7N7-1]